MRPEPMLLRAAGASVRHASTQALACGSRGSGAAGCVTAFTQTTHWGELVQGPLRFRGRPITVLITLPRRDLFSTALFTPAPGELNVEPAWCVKARRAARLVLDRAGRSTTGGALVLTSNIPIGCGGGSTTADVTATIRAVAEAVGLKLSAGQVQRMDWEVEGAADPLALLSCGRAVVYGSRSGRVVRWLSRPLPPMWCLGFNTRPGEVVLTDDLAARTEYRPSEELAFRRILQRASDAIESGRIGELARAATDSVRLNQGRLPTRGFDDLVRAVGATGGAGLSVSHSGTVGAAIFDPAGPDVGRRMAELASIVRSIGCGGVGPFAVIG